MKKAKGTQYQSHAKRRTTDTLGRPMRRPSFGLIETPNGFVVSEFVANQIIRDNPALAGMLKHVDKPVYRRGKKIFRGSRPLTKRIYVPVNTSVVDDIVSAVKSWALRRFRRDLIKLQREQNERHKDISSRFRNIKTDRYRRDGSVKEGCTAREHAEWIARLDEARPSINWFGLEMIRQGIIV